MCKFNSIDTIEAKTFFDILQTRNYQLLKPKPREKGLEQVFMGIYDEYFVKSDNYEAKEYLTTKDEIIFLEYKINTLKTYAMTMYSLFYQLPKDKVKKHLIDFKEALKTGHNIDFDLTALFEEEIKRVLTQEIGIIQNDLSMAKMSYQDMTKVSKTKTTFDYYEHLAGLSNVLPNNSLVKENMTLAVYIALNNLAHKQKPKPTT